MRVVWWRVAAVGAVTAWTALAGAPTAHADPEDHEVVYCLAPVQAQPLRDAATALGADRAKVTDIPAWRRTDPDAFEKACQALYEAQKQPPQDTLDKVLPFLTGLFGALAAYVATAWQARVTAGRADRDALGAAATEFHDAALDHLATYGPARDDTRLDTARTALTARLLRGVSEHPSWPAAKAALDTLTTGPLSPAALDATTTAVPDPRPAQVEQVQVRVHRVAAALATPGRWHRALRREDTG